MTPSVEFHIRLRKLRERAGLSVSEVAKKLDVPISTYREWEYGRKIKGERPYVPLAQLLGVSLAELLTGQHTNLHQLIFYLEEIEKNTGKIKHLLGRMG